MAMASYTRLRTGEWGARIPREDVKPGDRVVVESRSLKARSEEVDKVIWRGNGVALCSLVPRPARRRGKPRNSRSVRPTEH